MFVSRGKATITGFLSQQADDTRAVLVGNKHRHGEAEVFDVLTDAEEVCGEVVVKEEVFDSRLDRCRGFGGAARASKSGSVSTELKLRSEKEKSITC